VIWEVVSWVVVVRFDFGFCFVCLFVIVSISCCLEYFRSFSLIFFLISLLGYFPVSNNKAKYLLDLQNALSSLLSVPCPQDKTREPTVLDMSRGTVIDWRFCLFVCFGCSDCLFVCLLVCLFVCLFVCLILLFSFLFDLLR
jgi:hypothetical protein